VDATLTARQIRRLYLGLRGDTLEREKRLPWRTCSICGLNWPRNKMYAMHDDDGRKTGYACEDCL